MYLDDEHIDGILEEVQECVNPLVHEYLLEIVDNMKKWRRRALHYHEHALREREARQRAEIKCDDARQWDARAILANAVGCDLSEDDDDE